MKASGRQFVAPPTPGEGLTDEERGQQGGRTGLWAAIVGLLAGTLYVLTLQPDFGGPEDTPKFQFLGHILGTAHPPGYPTYVVLTHLFDRLPFGTVAYRANLFSAVMAALSCSVTFVTGRLIGASRVASAGAALGLATGISFWRSAVFAEVYSLAAMLCALTLALLLLWGASGRPTWLLASVAAFSLALGNHLTVVGIAPAMLGYVLLKNRRAVTVRIAMAACGLLLLGVAQYGFIVVRTRQNASYLESRARSLSELRAVVTAERFAEQRFAFTINALVTEQAPVILRTIGEDLGAVGLILLVVGSVAAVRRRSDAGLLAAAAAGLFGMVLNLSGDIRGFVTPLMVCAWPFCALGVDAVRRVGRLRAGGAGVVLSVALAAAMPLANGISNYRNADQSDQTLAGRLFRSLFTELPDGAAVVAEDYFHDMGLKYFQFTGEARSSRRIFSLPFDAPTVRQFGFGDTPSATPGVQRPVFAFAPAATFLASQGLQFQPAPLPGPSLGEWLRELPAGTLIAAATSGLSGPLDLSPVGHAEARPMGRPQTFEALGVVAHRSGAKWNKSHQAASVVLDSPTLGAVVPPFAGTVRAVADAAGARIEIGDRTVAWTPAGVSLAAFSPEGVLMRTLAFPDGGPWRVPYAQALYQLTAQTACVTLTKDDWRDVTPVLTTGSWLTTILHRGSVVIETEVARETPAEFQAAGILGDAEARPAGVSNTTDGRAVWATELIRTGGRRSVFRLAADRAGFAARARVRSGVDDRVTICAFVPAPLFMKDGRDAVVKADFEAEAYFGAGWSAPQHTPTGPVRRAAERATLLLPLDDGSASAILFDFASMPAGGLEILADGTNVGRCGAETGASCEVTIPAGRGIRAITVVSESSALQAGSLMFRGARIRRVRSGN